MRRAVETLMDRLTDACDAGGADWGIRLDGGFEYAWSAEVRVTPEPNAEGKPDRSFVYYAAGGATADDVAEQALRAALQEVLP